MDFGELNDQQLKVAKMVADKAREANIDPELALALAWTENEFKPKGLSSKGAIGPMQVLPTTGKAYGYETRELHETETNIEAGIKILRDNLDAFKGNTRAALAAYNGRWDRAQAFVKGDEDFTALHPDTRGYLEKIDRYRNTDAPGYLQPVSDQPNQFGEIPVFEGETLINRSDVPQQAPQEAPSPFGEIDPGGVMSQPDATETKQDGQPPAKPSLGDRAMGAVEDAAGKINESPELAGAVASGATAGALLGKYGKDTLDRQTNKFQDAQEAFNAAKDKEGIARGAATKTASALDQTHQEILDQVKAREAKFQQMRRLIEQTDAEVAKFKPPEMSGAQKWTATMGGEDVPLAQRMEAENMRANNPKGGQAIINQNTAAKQKLAGMGLSDYRLTEPAPGQLALPSDLAKQREAQRLAEQQRAQRSALYAQQKGQVAQEELAAQQRLLEASEKNRLRNAARSAEGITKAEGDTQAAQKALERARVKAPTGFGKVGVFAGKVAGKTLGALSGAAVPLAANEASERWNSGDRSGAVLSGVEALAGVLAMLPPATPITAALKGIGITGGLAVAVVDAYLRSDYAKKRTQAPKPMPAPQATAGGLNRVSSNNKPPVSGITKDAYGRYHG